MDVGNKSKSASKAYILLSQKTFLEFVGQILLFANKKLLKEELLNTRIFCGSYLDEYFTKGPSKTI